MFVMSSVTTFYMNEINLICRPAIMLKYYDCYLHNDIYLYIIQYTHTNTHTYTQIRTTTHSQICKFVTNQNYYDNKK